MKTIPPNIAAQYAAEVSTLCTCWKATLQNGTVYGFTDNVDDLLIGGVLYEAAAGYTPSAIQDKQDLSVSNLELQGLLNSDRITVQDLNAGLWDFAAIEVFQVDYLAPTAGQVILSSGRIGEVSYGETTFTAEMRSQTQLLQQSIGDIYSPSCRAILGDARCKVNLPAITDTAAVTAVLGETAIQIDGAALGKAPDWYGGGLATFTSGLNIGLSMEVKSSAAGDIGLYLPMPFAVTAGDALTIAPGCRKRFQQDCIGKYSNAINFRGEPLVPGQDAVMQTGGANRG